MCKIKKSLKFFEMSTVPARVPMHVPIHCAWSGVSLLFVVFLLCVFLLMFSLILWLFVMDQTSCVESVPDKITDEDFEGW
jgi:hypothetical protein